MPLELKFMKCFELCTQLPILECTLESSVFLLQGYECFFRFVLEKETKWYYNLYIEVKSGHSKWDPYDLFVEAGFQNEQNFSLGPKRRAMLIEPEAQQIWFMEFDALNTKLPSNYLDGNWIKFRVYFKNLDEHHLKTRKEMDDKCLQTGSYLTTDVSAESLTEDMSKLLDIGEDHDAEIKSGQYSIKAHKNILCARSEVFKAMLQIDMVEGRTGVVEIKDMDETCIQDFVRYLYTAALPELTFQKAKVLYEAGDKYAVPSLMFRCSEYLQDTLSPENAFECLALADAHSDEKLKDRFIAFSLEKKMYLEKELWLPVCESYPEIAFEVCKLVHENLSGNKGV